MKMRITISLAFVERFCCERSFGKQLCGEGLCGSGGVGGCGPVGVGISLVRGYRLQWTLVGSSAPLQAWGEVTCGKMECSLLALQRQVLRRRGTGEEQSIQIDVLCIILLIFVILLLTTDTLVSCVTTGMLV